MSSNAFDVFREFQNILVVCPACGEIHRLSDLKLSYRGKATHSWWDAIVEADVEATEAEARLRDKWKEIRLKTAEKSRKQLPKLLKRCAPGICAHGFYPQDVKTICDPVNFIVFDGMNTRPAVRRVVLLDGPANDKRRETAQRSIQSALRKGNYQWKTIRLDEKGRIKA